MNTHVVYRTMKECRNFFETGYVKREFTITGGAISPAGIFPVGSYIAIEGSNFYSGVYRVMQGGVLEGIPVDAFNDKFVGRVWFLRPPAGFLELCSQISEYIEKTPKGAYQSESFGDYSYTRANGKNGGVLTWQENFGEELAQYRHMLSEVMV